MQENSFDVLIVGAGMIGSALAVALGDYNLNIAIFDRNPPKPFNHDQMLDLRVSALSYASEQILRQLNVWNHMKSMRMCPYRKMAVWERLKEPFNSISAHLNRTVFDSSSICHDQLGFIVENRVVQLSLQQSMKAYKNIKFICPTLIKNINISEESQKLTLDDDRVFCGKLIIGADGVNSQVRKNANLGITQKDYEQQCLVATVEIVDGDQDTTWQAFTPTGPQSFLPLPSINKKNFASIVWYNNPENISRLISLRDSEFIRELIKIFPHELPDIINVHNRGCFPLTRLHAQKYYRTGVVLTGDAAHSINPLAGQGVNLGFQDVAWLAEILVNAHQAGEHIGRSEVLARYEKIRRPENQKMMTIMDGFYHTFSNNNLSLKLLRNIGLTLAGNCSAASNLMMKYAMGITGKQSKLSQCLPLI